VKRGTTEHPKLLDLAEAVHQHLEDLDIDLPYEACEALVCGMVEKLFHTTARYAPAGDIGKHSNTRIARAMGWVWDADWLIDTMSSDKCRWLDTDISGARLYVHDWHEHSDDTSDRYLADNGLRYANGNDPRHKPRKGSKAWIPPEENPPANRPRPPASARDVPRSARKPEPKPTPEPKPKSESKPEPEPTPAPPPGPAVAGDGGDDDGLTWKHVQNRLASLQIATWDQTATNARLMGATPDIAMRIIDYGVEHNLGRGAIVFRLENHHPKLELAHGWPIPDEEDVDPGGKQRQAASFRERRALERQQAARAEQIIKNSRRDGKTDDQIREQLKLAGLEWPA
jgi:hypothetical protein